MTGIVEMTRTFGLELLESMLTQFPSVFIKHAPFRALLKERVCSLVIKLFSPNIKYNNRSGGGGSSGQSYSQVNDKPLIYIVIYIKIPTPKVRNKKIFFIFF